MQFRSVVELGGKTATGIPVPASVVEGLGAGKRPAVTVTSPGTRIEHDRADGRCVLPAVECGAPYGRGARRGDEVDVDVELDTAPRTVDVPDGPGRRARRRPGSPGGIRACPTAPTPARPAVEGAKTDETRQRRIAKSVAELSDGRRTEPVRGWCTVRDAGGRGPRRWCALYRGYAEFYGVHQDDAMRATVWSWIHDPRRRRDAWSPRPTTAWSAWPTRGSSPGRCPLGR